LSASSGSGRCRAFASSHGARIHTLRSSSVVRTALDRSLDRNVPDADAKSTAGEAMWW
jgi:hypothetical protein